MLCVTCKSTCIYKLVLTVCSGGVLECPPGAAKCIFAFIEPFSAIPGVAITVPNCSENPPVHLDQAIGFLSLQFLKCMKKNLRTTLINDKGK